MATATTASPTRAEIFRQGLKDARGTIIFWDRKPREDGTFSRGEWGKLSLDADPSIKYFANIESFPPSDRQFIQQGCRVIFDANPRKEELCGSGRKRPKDPKVSKVRLIVVNQ